MKLELVKGIQKLFKNIAKNTIGKSFCYVFQEDVYKRQMWNTELFLNSDTHTSCSTCNHAHSCFQACCI